MAKKPVTQSSEEAKAQAIKKMKETQARMAELEKDATEEQAEILKNPPKIPEKKAEKGRKKFEDVKDEKGVIMLRQVKVYSPFQTYFDNVAYSVSAVNGTGPFDILPGHKNFLSLLLPGEVIVRTARDEEKLKIDRGIMHVHDNSVVVFLDV